MADTIIIRCTHCGEKIGEISYIPGEQFLGCPNCKKRTHVIIDSDGKLFTYRA
ncbi:MAG: hypothetical protein LKI53_04735 [Bacteroidales bacterium]|jgi:Zn finger protein HypA/HybF involved in hydrogenase expression|nr:hypothetical protein [Bacteroidales bacterium]